MTSGRLPADPRLRPTAALLRAAVVGLLGLLVAVLAHKPAGILVVLPLVVWAVAAHAWSALRSADDGRGDTVALTAAVSRDRIREGDTGAVGVTARAGGSTPLPVSATWPRRAGLRHRPRAGSLLAVGDVRADIRADTWGSYDLGPVRAVVTDPLGARRTQAHLPMRSLAVTPEAETLVAGTDMPRTIGVSGPHLSPRRGSGTALAEVREFARGDRLSRINWPVTSRTGRLHTNATFTEQDTDVVIVVDTLADIPSHPGFLPRHGDGGPSSLDLTIRATGAIARHHLGIGDRVGILDLGTLIGDVPVGAGAAQLGAVMTALARTDREPPPLARVRPLGAIRPGSLVIVCSPLLEARVIERIGELAARGVELLIVDTLPPATGDPEALARRRSVTGRPRSHANDHWDEAWALRRLQQESRCRALRSRGIPVVAWDGPGTLAAVLAAMSLAARAPRMRRR